MRKNKKKNSPLTLRERTIIEVRYRDGNSIRSIAEEIDRNPSTISREIAGKPFRGIGKYIADVSHRKALKRIAKRGNKYKLDKNEHLKEYVIKKMKLGWSPEQISLRLSVDYEKDKNMHTSHESIYQYIYAQIHRGGNGNVKKGCEDLRKYLIRRHRRRIKKGFRKAQRIERKNSLPSIENRPKIVEKRSRIGDWEDDLIVSRKSKDCIKSINERKSGIVLFGKAKNSTAKVCDKVLFNKLNVIPSKYLNTLTRDNGSENKDYRNVEKKLNIKVYYAHPYHSWERGSNENCNGLLRRFFPKRTDWSKITDKEITKAEYLINTRPRKRFGGRTPAEIFFKETGVALFS
jgi:IS30 family transposase